MDFPAAGVHLPVISCLGWESWGGSGFTTGVGASAVWPTANLEIIVPLTIRSPYLIRKLWWCNGSAVAGNVDIAVHTLGGARLVSAGATAQAGTAVVQSVTLGTPFLLTPGAYYMGMSASSTSAQFIRAAPATTELQMAGCAQMASAHPIPDPVTLATDTTNYLPYFGIASASVI